MHRPLAPASELSKYHGACIFDELGKHMLRHCPVAKGKQREYQRLLELHGYHGILPQCPQFLHWAFCRDIVSRLGSGKAGKGWQRSTHRDFVRVLRRGMEEREREREAVDDSEDEFEEPEELRRVTVGRGLTEKAENMKRRTIQFTEWCETACGTGAQHQHRRKKRPLEQEREGPRIFLDACSVRR